MPKVPKKFAVPLSSSVSRMTYDRAHKLQQKWDALSLDKLGVRVKMSDLAEVIWGAGLRVLEQFDDESVLEAVKQIKEGRGIGSFEFRVGLEPKKD